MKLLLDTHSFLWFIDGNPRLSATVRELIEDPANKRLVSMASLWEMAIKVSIGRLTFAQPFATLMADQLRRNSMQVLDITLEHTAHVATLPFYHRDPFDRMLIAQSLVETIPIVGVDSAFDAYGVTRLW
jgi:PIN domain nuclease of toxin-antitoxin system